MDDKLDTYSISRKITTTEFADLISDYVNSHRCADGIAIGKELLGTHPTLQADAVGLMLNILYAMADKPYTDARNETAIATARKIRDMVDAGELGRGFYN